MPFRCHASMLLTLYAPRVRYVIYAIDYLLTTPLLHTARDMLLRAMPDDGYAAMMLPATDYCRCQRAFSAIRYWYLRLSLPSTFRASRLSSPIRHASPLLLSFFFPDYCR